MPDREKVIKALELCESDSECTGCPYEETCFGDKENIQLGHKVRMDAIALLKEQAGIIDSLKSDLGETLDVVTNRKNVVRCKDCWRKGNPYLCRFDRDLEEHGSHRTEADDDWFCADGERKDDDG